MTFDAQIDALNVASHFASQIKERIIVITGVNPKGLGFSTAEAFASQRPRVLILAGRNECKVQECISTLSTRYPEVKYLYLNLDLSSLSCVRSAAASLMNNPDIPHVDLLINNAGLGSPNPDRVLTSDGIELHFATNHIGLFLFTNLLLPKLMTAPKDSANGTTRVINLTSGGHSYSPVRFSDLNFERPPSKSPPDEQPDIGKVQRLQPTSSS